MTTRKDELIVHNVLQIAGGYLAKARVLAIQAGLSPERIAWIETVEEQLLALVEGGPER